MRRRTSRKPAVSRTARLEEKLDGLVSMLKAGGHSEGSVTTPAAAPVAGNRNLPLRGSNDYDRTVPVMTPSTDDSIRSSNNLQVYDFFDSGSSIAKAEAYLIDFQTYKAKYIPYVHIPLTTTAQELRRERPFLWLCIMAVSSRSTSEQQLLGCKVRERIAQEMVIQSEKSLDLLLGILTFICWYDISGS